MDGTVEPEQVERGEEERASERLSTREAEGDEEEPEGEEEERGDDGVCQLHDCRRAPPGPGEEHAPCCLQESGLQGERRRIPQHRLRRLPGTPRKSLLHTREVVVLVGIEVGRDAAVPLVAHAQRLRRLHERGKDEHARPEDDAPAQTHGKSVRATAPNPKRQEPIR